MSWLRLPEQDVCELILENVTSDCMETNFL